EDRIAAADQVLEQLFIRDGVNEEFEAAVAFQRGDVVVAARRQVVERDYVVPLGEQLFAQKAADKACSTGHQVPHPQCSASDCCVRTYTIENVANCSGRDCSTFYEAKAQKVQTKAQLWMYSNKPAPRRSRLR